MGLVQSLLILSLHPKIDGLLFLRALRIALVVCSCFPTIHCRYILKTPWLKMLQIWSLKSVDRHVLRSYSEIKFWVSKCSVGAFVCVGFSPQINLLSFLFLAQDRKFQFAAQERNHWSPSRGRPALGVQAQKTRRGSIQTQKVTLATRCRLRGAGSGTAATAARLPPRLRPRHSRRGHNSAPGRRVPSPASRKQRQPRQRECRPRGGIQGERVQAQARKWVPVAEAGCGGVPPQAGPRIPAQEGGGGGLPAQEGSRVSAEEGRRSFPAEEGCFHPMGGGGGGIAGGGGGSATAAATRTKGDQERHTEGRLVSTEKKRRRLPVKESRRKTRNSRVL